MQKKDFGILSKESLDLGLSLLKRRVFYPSVGVLLFSVLQSDMQHPKPTEEEQYIPAMQPMQYRHHDWFILPLKT